MVVQYESGEIFKIVVCDISMRSWWWCVSGENYCDGVKNSCGGVE